jgi:hypothetical protein
MKVIPTLACLRQKQWVFFLSSLIYNTSSAMQIHTSVFINDDEGNIYSSASSMTSPKARVGENYW